MSGKKNTKKKNNAVRSGTAAKNTAAKSTKSASASSAKKKKLTMAQRRELERQQRITQLLVIVGSIVVAFIVIIICIVILENPNGNQTDYTSGTSSSTSTLGAGVYPASSDYVTAPDGEQLKKPSKGEEVAVLETSMGTIKIRLFPEYVPTAVENFKTLIKEGYYDGIIFHRVIDDFMIQTGDPTGTGGDCAFDGYDAFEDEFGRNLYNLRGAVSMANAGTNTNSSQFFIVQTDSALYGDLVSAEGFKSQGGAEWAAEAYEKYGGTPYLDGQFKAITGSGHTVFGQVYEGLDIVDKIAGVTTDSSNKPVTDITIKKAYLETVA